MSYTGSIWGGAGTIGLTMKLTDPSKKTVTLTGTANGLYGRGNWGYSNCTVKSAPSPYATSWTVVVNVTDPESNFGISIGTNGDSDKGNGYLATISSISVSYTHLTLPTIYSV